MMKYVNYNIVFQEIPEEITLAINISNCPFSCIECHSPYLQDDIGLELTDEILMKAIRRYKGITCVCFMGGDSDIDSLVKFLRLIKSMNLMTGWYSGNSQLPPNSVCESLDYIKIGNYDPLRGGLDDPNTNQIMYKITKKDNELIFNDITYKFIESKLISE